MDFKAKFISAILILTLLFTQISVISAFSLENDDVNSTAVQDIDIVDNQVENDSDADLYYDATDDVSLGYLEENSKPLQDAKTTVSLRPNSRERFLSEKELPSSVNLSTSKHIPPIINQGMYPTCVSMSSTYMQFTNAISRYIEKNNIDNAWNPKLNKENRFDPYWTYTIAGGYTGGTIQALAESGGVTMDARTGNPAQIPHEAMDDALKYRIRSTKYDWLSISNSEQFTYTDEGKLKFNAVKSLLALGNVVTASCHFYDFVYSEVTGEGDIGKVGEQAVVLAAGPAKSGHQMSIVGYDDNLQVTYNSVTLTGAFLVANSHGTDYKNNGYVWVMYDSINGASEYEELNTIKEKRHPSFDCFNFYFWDEDVVVKNPDLVIGITVESYDRFDFKLTLNQEREESTDTSTDNHFIVGSKPISKYNTASPNLYQPLSYDIYDDRSAENLSERNYSFSGDYARFLEAPETATLYFDLSYFFDFTTDVSYGATIRCASLSGHNISVKGMSLIDGRTGEVLAGGQYDNPIVVEDKEVIDLPMLDVSHYPIMNEEQKPEVSLNKVDGNVEITWTTVEKAEGYKIFRGESRGVYELIYDCKSGLITKYIDKDCPQTGDCYYRVIAYDKVNDEYTYSSSVPTGIHLTFNGVKVFSTLSTPSGISVSWHGFAWANKYIVYRRDAESSNWVKIDSIYKDTPLTLVGVPKESISIIDTGAVKNKNYYYTVQAVKESPDEVIFAPYDTVGKRGILYAIIVSDIFIVSDLVSLTANSTTWNGFTLSPVVTSFNYEVVSVEGGLLTLGLDVTGELINSVGVTNPVEFLALYGLTEDDHPEFVSTIKNGQTYNLRFNMNSEYCTKVNNDTTVPDVPKDYNIADANCDGDINMVDVTTIQKVIAKLMDYTTLGENSEKNCDCDRDGVVTMSDVTLLQKHLAKIVDVL